MNQLVNLALYHSCTACTVHTRTLQPDHGKLCVWRQNCERGSQRLCPTLRYTASALSMSACCRCISAAVKGPSTTDECSLALITYSDSLSSSSAAATGGEARMSLSSALRAVGRCGCCGGAAASEAASWRRLRPNMSYMPSRTH